MAASTGDNLTVPPMTIIETDRLRLRTLSLSDVDAAMPLLSNAEVMKWTSSRLPINERSSAERWIGDRALGPDVLNFAIELRHADGHARENVFVGICGSFHPPACGYMIRPEHAGKGYATEALRAFVPAFFDRFPKASNDGVGFDFLTGMTDPVNYASMRVLEKCGFERIGVVENDFHNPSMGIRSSVVFRMARPGTTLEEIGAASLKVGPAQSEDVPPTPPVQ